MGTTYEWNHEYEMLLTILGQKSARYNWLSNKTFYNRYYSLFTEINLQTGITITNLRQKFFPYFCDVTNYSNTIYRIL